MKILTDTELDSMMEPINEAIMQLLIQPEVTHIKGKRWTVYRTTNCIRIDIYHQQGE